MMLSKSSPQQPCWLTWRQANRWLPVVHVARLSTSTPAHAINMSSGRR